MGGSKRKRLFNGRKNGRFSSKSTPKTINLPVAKMDDVEDILLNTYPPVPPHIEALVAKFNALPRRQWVKPYEEHSLVISPCFHVLIKDTSLSCPCKRIFICCTEAKLVAVEGLVPPDFVEMKPEKKAEIVAEELLNAFVRGIAAETKCHRRMKPMRPWSWMCSNRWFAQEINDIFHWWAVEEPFMGFTRPGEQIKEPKLCIQVRQTSRALKAMEIVRRKAEEEAKQAEKRAAEVKQREVWRCIKPVCVDAGRHAIFLE